MAGELEIGDINSPIQLDMNRATIVVLGDVLENLIENAIQRNEIDQPQAHALWYLEGAIEAVCADSFRPDYVKILQAAKKSLGENE